MVMINTNEQNEIDKNKLTCPMTKKIFFDPVTAQDGLTYECQFIQNWLREHDISPVTSELMEDELSSNEEILNQVEQYLTSNPNELINQYIPSARFEDNIIIITQLIESKNYTNLLSYTHFDLNLLFNMITNIENFMHNEELVVIHIINNALDLEQVIVHGWRLIHVMSLYSPRLLEFLIKKGVDLNAFEENGMTPLHIVTRQGIFESIEILIKYGANPIKCSEDGWTALHYACKCTNLKIVTYFVELYESNSEYKKYLEMPTSDTWTPLQLTCHHGTSSMIKYMLSKVKNINDTTKEGWTALNIVCYIGNAEIIKYFLDTNVDRSKKVIWLDDKPVKCGYLELIELNKSLTKSEKKELKNYKRVTYKKRK